MWIRRVVFVGLVLFAVTASLGAKSTRLVGAVASVTSSTLDVNTKSEGTKSVRLDARTAYLTWTTAKPFQAGGALSLSALSVGRCVEVDLRAAASDEAKVVWISTATIGSMADPCHTFRK
ncbi:MAG TPA: hypothetical protein VLV86_12405 [Vicinamibacterales bacterium]|nr:hypothetical protein [Vicinamibacterales bacterium]